MEWGNELDRICRRNLKRRLFTSSEGWLMRAIKQKNAHLSVGVAYSELLAYDQLDRKLMAAVNSNLRN